MYKRQVLSYQSKSHIAALNETYLLVLNRQLADLNAEEKKETCLLYTSDAADEL